jgi:hypothetical protein
MMKILSKLEQKRMPYNLQKLLQMLLDTRQFKTCCEFADLSLDLD